MRFESYLNVAIRSRVLIAEARN